MVKPIYEWVPRDIESFIDQIEKVAGEPDAYTRDELASWLRTAALAVKGLTLRGAGAGGSGSSGNYPSRSPDGVALERKNPPPGGDGDGL